MIPHSRPTLGPKEAAAAARVIRSGMVAQGREVESFEREMARFLGLRGAVAVSSGTAALYLALRALGVKDGKEVLMPSYVCSALPHACRLAGGKVALTDVDPRDYNLSADDARRRLTRRTAAAVVVHSFGAPAELDRLLRLGVPVVEDLAQALGGAAEGKKLGTRGAAAVLSFYATKLMTTGEGGMVVSNDRRLLAAVRNWRDYDERPAGAARFNFKMTDLQAAVGRVQLGRLPSFLDARRERAADYRRALPWLEPQTPAPGHAYHRFVVRSDRPVDLVLRLFHRRGIGVRRPVFRPLHWDVPSRGSFPGAEEAWRRALSLPLYPSLTEKEFHRIVMKAKEVLI